MSQPRILVVEDESIVAIGIEYRLEALGYRVAARAVSGEVAIQKAVETRPDLVLMDIQLQDDMDGIEAAEQIRRRLHIPVVYLTAHTDHNTFQRAKLTDPFGYIVKPFQERDLHITIEMALYKHQMEQRLAKNERWLATTLKSIGEAVIATDANGRIIFMNPAAEVLTGWQQAEAIGLKLPAVFKIVDEETGNIFENQAVKAIDTGEKITLSNHTLLISKNDRQIPIADSVAPIKDAAGNIAGAVLVFQDISERRQVESDREQLIAELQEALDTIAVLTGIIPICASCKKIRNEAGDWQPIELFIRNHSTVEFSHGICPDCASNLYPDFFKDDS
jgi:PAS domain S-box-containing protein